MADRRKRFVNWLLGRENENENMEIELPDLENAPLLTKADVEMFFASVDKDYLKERRLNDLLYVAEDYEQTFSNTTIPKLGDSDYVEKMTDMNASMMRKNETMLLQYAEASADFFERSVSAKESGKRKLAEKYEKMGIVLKKLAENMQAQKVGIIHLYDQTMNYRSKNSDLYETVAHKSVYEVYQTMKVFVKKEDEGETLGSGALNTVYKVDVDNEEHVFKQGKVNVHTMEPTDETLEFFGIHEGLKANKTKVGNRTVYSIPDVDTAKRDVAFSRVDQLFGFNISVFTTIARSETGELSSLMELSKGSKVSSHVFTSHPNHENMIREYQSETYEELNAARRAKENEDKNRLYPCDDPNSYAKWDRKATGEMRQIVEGLKREGKSNEMINGAEVIEQILFDEVPGRNYFINVNALSDKLTNLEDYQIRSEEIVKKQNILKTSDLIDIRDSTLNKSLMELAALDYICTHTDRHLGNYMMVKKDGKYHVQAIDNDTAFMSTEQFSVGQNVPEIDLNYNFPFVDANLKAKVESIQPKQLEKCLTGLLNDNQIKVACSRLEQLQNHFKTIPVVTGDLTPDQIDQLLNLPEEDARKSYNAFLNSNSCEKDGTTFQEWIRKKPEYLDILMQEEAAKKRALVAPTVEAVQGELASWEELDVFFSISTRVVGNSAEFDKIRNLVGKLREYDQKNPNVSMDILEERSMVIDEIHQAGVQYLGSRFNARSDTGKKRLEKVTALVQLCAREKQLMESKEDVSHFCGKPWGEMLESVTKETLESLGKTASKNPMIEQTTFKKEFAWENKKKSNVRFRNAAETLKKRKEDPNYGNDGEQKEEAGKMKDVPGKKYK